MTINPTTKTALETAEAEVDRVFNALDAAREHSASCRRVLRAAEERESGLETELKMALDARTAAAAEVYIR